MSKSKFQKPSAGGTQQQKSSKLSTTKVPLYPTSVMLIRNSSTGQSNLRDFKLKLRPAVANAYGEGGIVSQIIETADFVKIDMPRRPVFDKDAGGNFVLSLEDRSDEVDTYERLKNITIQRRGKIDSLMSPLYTTILAHVSEESEAVIMDDPDFEAAKKAECPVLLMRLINKTHLLKTHNESISRMRAEANRRFFNFRMLPGETVRRYKERFDEALGVFETLELAVPELPIQIEIFLAGLEASRFSEYQLGVANKALVAPDTLQKAYEAASAFKVSLKAGGQSSAPNLSASVFATGSSADSGKKGKKGQNRQVASSAAAVATHRDKAKDSPRPDAGKKQGDDAAGGGKATTERVPPRDCVVCAKVKKMEPAARKHWPSNCPWLQYAQECAEEQAQTSTTSAFLAIGTSVPKERKPSTSLAGVLAITKYSRPGDVYLDSCSGVSAFTDGFMLTDIEKAPSKLRINGADTTGKGLLIEQQGHFLGMQVYYNPTLPANILSLHFVRERYKVVTDDDSGEVTVCGTPFGDLVFKTQEGEYMLKANLAYTAPRSAAMLATVAEIEARFTKRQVLDAREARELEARLMHFGTGKLVRAARYGTIKNMPVTSQDLYRANAIYGPSVPHLKGTTVTRPHKVHKDEWVPRMAPLTLELHVDIMFVNGMPFLYGVLTPLWLHIVIRLRTKAASSLQAGVAEILSNCAAEHFIVTVLHTDMEGGMKAILNWIERQGIKTTPHGKQPVVENAIRRCKEGVRCFVCTWPGRLPDSIVDYCVRFRVYCTNLLPSSNTLHNLSPRVLFTGKTVDYNVHVRVRFLEYVQTHEPQPQPASLMNQVDRTRTRGALALLPLGNNTGSIQFLNLATFSVITRTAFTRFPVVPDTVYALLTAKADEQAARKKKPYREEPQFMIGSRELDDHAGDPDDDDTLVDDVPLQVDKPVLPPLRLVGVDDVQDQDDDPSHTVLADSLPVDDQPDVLPVEHEPLPEPPLATPEATHGGGAQSERATYDANLVLEDLEDDRPIETIETPSAEPSRPGSRARGGRVPLDSLQGLFNAASAAPRATQAARTMSFRQRSRIGATEQASHASSNIGMLHITVNNALNEMTRPALRSITLEVLQILDKGTWTPQTVKSLTKHQLSKIIRSSMFLKEKFSSTGEFEKLKARLVAGGNMQDRTEYDDVSSPTATTSSVFIAAAIAAKERRKAAKVDIGGAFLRAYLPKDTEILMRLNPLITAILTRIKPDYQPFVDTDGSLVVKLNRALYGVIEAAKLWHEELTTTLAALGYVPNPIDVCVFNRQAGDVQCTIVLHVDDLLITCRNEAIIDELIAALRDKYQEIEAKKGPVLSYVGMTFDFSVEGRVSISMKGYVYDLLDELDINGSAKTPATSDLFSVREDCPKLPQDRREQFHSNVAKVLYLAKRVRPDVLTACIFLATRVLCADTDDEAKLNRLLRYLNGTRDLDMKLIPNQGLLSISAYIDASYGVHFDGKSHTGLAVCIGKGPVFAKSAKQKLVSKSSTESELIALSDSLSQVIWTRDFLIHQGYKIGPATVYQDNMSTIALAEKGRSTSERTRHINIRFFFVKDRIGSGEVAIEYLPTQDMIADILTKPLQGELFLRLRKALLNCTD